MNTAIAIVATLALVAAGVFVVATLALIVGFIDDIFDSLFGD